MTPDMIHVEKTLGFVPHMFHTMETLPDNTEKLFDAVSQLVGGKGSIEHRHRALIGIGCGTAMGHRMIGSFYQELVPQLTQEEINEAQFVAADVVGWSTWWTIRTVDVEGWKKDVARIREALAKVLPGGPVLPREGNVNDQVRTAFGYVPTFLGELQGTPAVQAIVWDQVKRLLLTRGAIPPVTRNLIGVAAAAVRQCPYSTALFTELAVLHGATPVQILETGLIARGCAFFGSYLHARGFTPETARTDAARWRATLAASVGSARP